MKRLAALVLAAAVTCSALPFPALAAEETGFSDVMDGDWFAPYVEVCVREGLMIGVGDGRFDPEGPVNTDEAVVMAARLLWMADGGTGPLPKGPTAEEFYAQADGDAAQYYFLSSMDTAREYAGYWSWDGYTYLLRRAGEAGVAFDPGLISSYPATRYDFFHLLGFAAQGLALPDVNAVEAVPGTREAGILDLYRAGILAGTDGWGSFDGQMGLTRGEAAAALARVARPELRMEFEPLPAPYGGYTLTPLGEDTGGFGVHYSVYPRYGDILLINGETVPWPEGQVYSFGLRQTGDYCRFSVVVREPYDMMDWLMDREGNYAAASGQYEQLQATADGHFIGTRREGDVTRWFHINAAGEAEAELPSIEGTPDNDWWGFNQWVCPWLDEERGLWGYKDQEGNWAVEPVWSSAEAFQSGYAVVQNPLSGLYGVLGLDGTMVLPYQYQALFSAYYNSPGHEAPIYFAATDPEGRTGWVTPDGTWYERDQTLLDIPHFRNGYAVCRAGTYAKGHYYYLGPDTLRCSESFDWCGDIGPDGAGFVGLDGAIYRIEFEGV